MLPALALAGLAAAGPLAPAAAEEPLFLRIRPLGAQPATAGAAGMGEGLSEAEAARRARAAREAVWERSNARARIVIASVCTGCMKPLPPAPKTPADAATPVEATSPAEAAPGQAQPPATVPAGTLAALEPRPSDDAQTRPTRSAVAPHDEPEVTR